MKRSIHLVRAHIADYRNGRGLFGKYKQLVWIPAHLRSKANPNRRRRGSSAA